MSVERMLEQIQEEGQRRARELGQVWCGKTVHPFRQPGQSCRGCEQQEERLREFWAAMEGSR